MRGLFASILVCLLVACANAPTPHKLGSQKSPPPSIEELTIISNGQRMAGHIYIASGNGPHPTVVLLHGYPGNEKNLDLAQALRQQGWNVLFFHYRGAWGSEGEFSFLGAEQDVQEAINYLRNPKNARRLRVNADSISTVGHSMGGHMAVAGFLNDAQVRCSVALDGANMGANQGQGLFRDPRVGKVWREYSDTLFMLKGWSGDKALAEMEEYGAQLDLVPRASQAAGRPVMLLAADTEVIPLESHIVPLYEALQVSSGTNANYTVIDDDHSFSASRPELIETVQKFLDANCR